MNNLKEKEPSVTLPSLSFYVIFSTISDWAIQGSNVNKEGYDRVLGRSYFCLLSALRANSGSNGKSGLPKVSVYSIANVTCSPCTDFWVFLNSHVCRFTRILYSWGITNAICDRGGKKQKQTLMLHVSLTLKLLLHCSIVFHLHSRSSKIKLLKISRGQQSSIKPKHRALLSKGPVQLHQWYAQEVRATWILD